MASRSVDTVETKQKTGLQVYCSRRWDLFKTMFLVSTWIVLGVHAELVGPTLKILAQQTGTTFTGISSILAARGAGYIAGNIPGLVMQDIVKRYSESLLALAFLIASIVVLVTPYIGSLILLSVLFFFQGISQGLTDLGGTNIVLTMWGDHTSAAMNTVHLGFGFGAMFVNLLVAPFLANNELMSTNLTSNSTMESSFSSNIVIPYSITAILCSLIAVGHLFFSIREYRIRRGALRVQQVAYAVVAINPVAEPPVRYSQYSPRYCGHNDFCYGLVMSTIWIAYMFFVTGNDLTFGKFFFSYLESPKFELSTANASLGKILYWLSYSIGRLICAVVSLFVPVDVTLSVLWSGGLILAITWIVYVWTIGLSSTSLFILGSFTGLIFAPIFPLSFGFINQRLIVNPLLLGLILCGASLGGILFQKLAGALMDKNPQHFPTLLIICVLLSMTLYCTAFLLSWFRQRKVTKKRQRSISTSVPDLNEADL